MYNQYFGSYLLNRGLVSNLKLQELLQEVNQTQVKLGVLAINSGLMSSEQVEEVQGLQRQRDKRFGEIAVELGYLTDNQVGELLKEQNSSSLQLGQALIDAEVLKLEELEQILKEFKCEAAINNDIEKLIRDFLSISGRKVDAELIQYIGLCWRNLVRFIGNYPLLQLSNFDSLGELGVTQNFEGEGLLKTYLYMDEVTYLQIAESYAKMPITERSELADASVTEFLNLHNGIYAVNMSEKGKELKLLPPKVLSNGDFSSLGKDCIRADFKLSFGKISILID